MSGCQRPEIAQPVAPAPFDSTGSTGAPARRPAVFATTGAPANTHLGPGTNAPGEAQQGRENQPPQSISPAHQDELSPAQAPVRRSAPLPPVGSTRRKPAPSQAVPPSDRPGSLSRSRATGGNIVLPGAACPAANRFRPAPRWLHARYSQGSGASQRGSAPPESIVEPPPAFRPAARSWR